MEKIDTKLAQFAGMGVRIGTKILDGSADDRERVMRGQSDIEKHEAFKFSPECWIRFAGREIIVCVLAGLTYFEQDFDESDFMGTPGNMAAKQLLSIQLAVEFELDRVRSEGEGCNE